MQIDAGTWYAVIRAITLIGQGHTRTKACDECGVTVVTLDKYVKTFPELTDMYKEADERGRDAIADALLRPMDHPIYGHTDARMASVWSKNAQWLLARRDSARYGDKMVVQHNVSLDGAILEAMERGRKRVEQDIIDADYVVVSPALPAPAPQEDAELAAFLRSFMSPVSA